jgi:uncharacterized protein YneF (UPF0154 family)
MMCGTFITRRKIRRHIKVTPRGGNPNMKKIMFPAGICAYGKQAFIS